MSQRHQSETPEVSGAFLRNGGEMGRLIRTKDWSETALGPVESWPQSLKTAMGMMLAMEAPAGIFWSADLLFLYNDATRSLLGRRHPQALGHPLRAGLPDIWQEIGATIEDLLKQEGANPPERGRSAGGAVQDSAGTWFDYDCCPILDEDAVVAGFLGVAEKRRVSKENVILRSINRILEQAIRVDTEEELGQTCLTEAIALTDSQIGFVSTTDGAGNFRDIAIRDGRTEPCRIGDMASHYDARGDGLRRGLCRRILSDGAPHLTNQPPAHDSGTTLPPGHPPINSFLGVPLQEAGRTIGLLAVANRQEGYSHEEQEILESLAPTVAEVLLRKRAESALRESEERFRFVASNVPETLFFQDLDLRYVWIHKPVDPLSSSDVIGQTDAALLPPSEAAQLTQIKQEVIRTGVARRAEIPLSPGGRTRWYEAVYRPAQDDQGQIIGLVSYSREITGRKVAEIALSRSQEDLARAQEVGQIGSWRLDVVRNVLTWSDECHRIFGVPKGTPLSYETFLSVVHPDDRAYVDIQWHMAQRGQPYDIEHRIVVNGKVRWVREKAYMETDQVGHLLSGFGITQDITERRRTEDALRLERDKLQAVIDNASFGIGITDREGTTLLVNREALRIHGFDADTDVLPGLDGYVAAFRLHYPDGRPVPEEDWPMARALRGEYVTDFEVRLEQDGKEPRYVSYSVTPIRDAHGQATLQVYNILDLTEQKRIETDLRRERQLLQTIYDTVPVMLTIYDPELEGITLNKHLERVTGWTPEDAAEANLMELVYPDPAYRTEVTAYMQSLAPGFKDIRMATKDGGIVETSWANVRISDGRQVGIGIDISDRKRAEEERERLLAIIEATPDMVSYSTPDGQLRYLNRAGRRALGVPLDVPLEGRDIPMGHPEWAGRIVMETGIPAAIRDGAWLGETAVLRQDGTEIPVSQLILAHRDEHGALRYFSTICRDVSERQRTEDELRRYAERLRFLHQMDATILAARSAEAVAQAAVRHVPQLLPCTYASVVLHDPESGSRSVLAGYGRAAETDQGPAGTSWDVVAEQLRCGQAYLIEDVRALPVTSPRVAGLQAAGVRAQVYEPILINGEYVGTLGLDLAEPGTPTPEQMAILRELATQLAIGLEQARLYEEVQSYASGLEQLVHERTAALEASEARFRAIFEEAAIGIALADARGTLLTTNPALQRILGYSATELADVSLFDLLKPDGTASHQTWEPITGEGDRDYAVEVRYRRKSGAVGEANVVLSRLGRSDEASPLILALVEDITERKLAQQALIRTERLAIMGRMAASLAHEVNNPLQSVLGCLGLAVEALEDGEEATTYMDVAMDELARAARIVHRMRDLGRQEEGRKEQVVVNRLIDKVVILTRKQAENQLIAMAWESPDDPIQVPMVRDRIQQVFLNLVLNAIEAMPDGGTLTIRATRTEAPAGVRVTFTDTGVGIAPEDLAQMFEAFHSTKELGLGMGLYVSRNIVQEHGGRIDVESTLGTGSTFSVWLPA